VRVEELLQRSARRNPGKTAVICDGRRYSYEWVNDEATRLAQCLTRTGIRPGSRVGICLENSIEAIVWMFAVAMARATFFIVGPHVRPDRLRTLETDADAAAMIVRSAGQITVRQRQAFSSVGQVRAELAMRAGRPDEDLAAIVYTSGSTGAPKGVMLTHANLCAAATSITTYLANRSDEVIFSALPLSFTYGLGQVTTTFLAGATLVLARSFAYPQAVLDTLARENVTGLPVVPTMVTLLLQQGLAARRLPSLRYVTSAAAALVEDKVRQLRSALPGVEIYSMYGQTECQRATFLSPELLDRHPLSVGCAIPDATVAVVDEYGHDVAPGVVGELVVRGPQVMRGYWNQPEATMQALRPRPDGLQWLFTGDLFRQDTEGLLYFVERRDAMIKSRGEKVAPRAVEEVISRLPGVADVGVYGIPDDLLGQVVAAAVTLEQGASLTAAQVQRHCLAHLDSYMVPKVVEIRASLPTTATGKVSRAALLQEAVS
jgi:amino acid adenylation domain-containing protein